VVLFEARIKLLSPAIVTTRRTELGFVKPADHIPGSMLRGAILTALYLEGRLDRDDLEREAESPSLLASPAYPMLKGSKSLPATPSMMRCDRCHVIEYYGLPERLIAPKLYHECDGQQGHQEPLKPIHGSLVAVVDGELEEVRVSAFRATSVAIDKGRRVAARGMLFDYEAIAEGTEFWSLLLVPDQYRFNSIEVTVGRGRSRGFGSAALTVQPAQQHPGTEWYVALSPIVPQRRFGWRGCAVRLIEVFGRTSKLQTGWDYMRGRMRPIVRVARRGSLVKAEVMGESRDEVLRVGIPVKLGGFLLTGLNALIPLSEYESILGVKRSHE